VDIHYAIGAALVSVIATSSGAQQPYVREGYSNVRVGMFLEIATTVGALVGAALIVYLRVDHLDNFGVVLLYSAYASLTEHADSRQPRNPIDCHLAQDGQHLSRCERTGKLSCARSAAGFLGLMFVAECCRGCWGLDRER